MNSKFSRRIKYYLIGLGMGLVMTFFIFGNRGCSWLPENRVKEQIENGILVRSDSMKCILECNEISDDFIFTLIEKGEVLFSESETQKEPKVYVIEYKEVKVHFSLDEDSVASIVNVNGSADCNCSGQIVKPVKMTNKMIKSFLANRDFEIDSKTNCLRECLSAKRKDIFKFLETASAKESQIRRDNKNPTFDFISGDTIITVEHGVRKNRFIRIQFPESEKCDCGDQ
ncbi:MAG: hypothetical protein R2799_08805 [Crocinitomicaceae bacterium]